MIRRQVQLREDQWQALRRLAARQGVSVSELLRRSVDAWLRSQQALAVVDRRQRALTAIGRFRSAYRDVAERHDVHFAASLREENAP